ncbi:MAG: caspase family protein [Propionibacteriaceae bacterium]|jgi:hypothetical protein|nr:caspase family protein [Propionibacteriaceae bacterium]
MRKALIVGIDYYQKISQLHGAVNDAYDVMNVLERHADGTLNFPQPNLMVADGPQSAITRGELREAVATLFRDKTEISLFYFAGHGYVDNQAGYLCTSDVDEGHEGYSLSEVMTAAHDSPAQHTVIILDSCHSGRAGDTPIARGVSEIKDGMTILTASTAEQYATETNGSGLFTSLLVDALHGSAANLLGDVTPGSVYAHIDQSLGTWDQRPVFKTSVKQFISLRKAEAAIEQEDLRKITTLFENPSTQLRLDPSYEPERSGSEDPSTPPPDPAKNADFAVLQKLVKVNLVRPVGAPHMWHAAMESKACELTPLGQHYWRLGKKSLI